REERTQHVLLQDGLRFHLQFGREVESILERDALSGKRRRPGWNRLRLPGMLSRNVTRRHRPLVDRPNRFSGDAIENISESGFGQLNDSVDFPSLYINGGQNRR